MLVTVLAVVAAVAALVAVVLVMRRPASSDPQELAAVRNDVNLLRETTDRSLQGISAIFSAQLQAITGNVQTALATVNSDVANRLDALNQSMAQRLSENVSAMTATSKAVSDRIAQVQGTFAGLQNQIGELSQQARQLGEMSKSITELQHILTAPKLRGGFGEAQLETLLSMVFAREQYEMQHRFPSGDVADAVLFFPQGKVVIDSKFSLENFRRIAEARSDADKKAARRDFLKDVRKRIEEIAGKYIRPADGTLPFALMYIPAENVYYEAIIRDEDGSGLYDFCVDRHVMPVSPNSLYAYLHTIVVGLKSLQVSQQAEYILRQMESLRFELKKFTDTYDTLGKHLKNAGDRLEEGARLLGKLENRVQNLAGNGVAQPELPLAEEKRALGAAE